METLVAYHLLVDHGRFLHEYDSLPPREKRLTNEMVFQELNQRKKELEAARRK